MRKYLILLLLLFLPLVLTGCASEEQGLVLRVYNWQDYIDEGLDDDGQKIGTSVIEEWQEWYYQTYNTKVDVVYDTFETCETMMNNLKTGKTTYDLVCPSEYTIQKMIRLEMLDTYDYNLKDEKGNLVMTNYNYVSPYLKELFSKQGWEQYAVPYMWGTMGFIYNPEAKVEGANLENIYEDILHWSILWNENYKNCATVKDSIRDTYVVGVMYVYYEELMTLKDNYQKGNITQSQYTQSIQEIMNRCDDETLSKVEKALKEMKKNAFGFEVDSGKSDIVTGKIAINFAWSGDAVYSLDVAEEENGVYLNYQVPEEGSNVWFDGWVMPKGANKQLAQSFVNYLCDPQIAVRNMNYIGYTSSIVGDEILDMIDDWYGAILPEYNEETSTWWYDEVNLNIGDSTLEVSIIDNEIYLGTKKIIDVLDTIKDEEGTSYSEYYNCTYYEVDLSYLFEGAVSEDYLTDGKVIVAVEERGRQFDTQYPDYETISRCGIMEDFGDRNDAVLAMWENVKIGDIPISLTIGLVVVVITLFVALNVNKYIKVSQRKKRKQKYDLSNGSN